MNYNLNLKDTYFQAIKNGDKVIEGRTPNDENDKRYDEMISGDTITLTNIETDEELICQILSVSKYPDVETMLNTEGIQNCLPGVTNIENGVKIYHNLEGYKERIKKYGIYAIKIILNK